jgi:hypothetical protein
LSSPEEESEVKITSARSEVNTSIENLDMEIETMLQSRAKTNRRDELSGALYKMCDDVNMNLG